MRKMAGIVSIILILGGLLACRWIWRSPHWASASSSIPPSLWQFPNFKFIDQLGRSVSNDSLRGKLWICDFFLTHCNGPCPKMTAAMQSLQKLMGNKPITFLSFSIDPARDSVEVLKKYSDDVGADPDRWLFLTTDEAQIWATAAALKIAPEGPPRDDVILHSDRFFLIDQSGIVRAVYDSNDARQMRQLALDAEQLCGADSTGGTRTAAKPPEQLFDVFPDQVGPAAEAMVPDLVCGMSVPACSKSENAEYLGRSYYFCSASCKARFKANASIFLTGQNH